MDSTIDRLRFCTFNCRSVKNSFILDIRKLCESFDIVLLQEHWLLPYEIGILNDISCDYLAFGVSAVNLSDDLLRGRPYGGTAILYRKALAGGISVVDCHQPRMCAIKVDTDKGPILLINVYMPTDSSDDCSYGEYVDMCSKIITVFTDSDAVAFVAAGDFNCRPNSRFSKIFNQFLIQNDLVCIDFNHLDSVFTYVSDDGMRTSWIDHIICSRSLNTNFDDVKVLYEAVCSDHRPLCANFLCPVLCNPMNVNNDVRHPKYVPNWCKVTSDTIEYYKDSLNNYLTNIDIPKDLLSCTGACNMSDHHNLLDMYYNNIISCISCATEAVIPPHLVHNNQHNVPAGLNMLLKSMT